MDLISRQAVDKIINDLLKNDNLQASPSVWHGLQMIKQLPSAQPEIIKCKDCKHGSPNGKYGCRVYHYKRYETHDMKPDDFCSYAERRTDG